MVKENKEEVREVCLDSRKRLATTYTWLDNEQVTVPDVAPSLMSIVMTGNVGSMPSNSSRYSYGPQIDDDEELHETPDFMKLKDADLVERQQFIDEFVEQNQEKDEKDSGEETEIKEAEDAKAAEASGQ